MPEDKTTITADASSYFDVLRRAGQAADDFGTKTERAGKSVDGIRLKTEGRIAANIGALSRSFASGGSSADIFAEAVTRLSESFRGSLLFAGVAAAGANILEAITKPIEALIKFKTEIASLTRSEGPSDFLGTDQANKNLTEIADKLQEIFERHAQAKLPSNLGSALFSPFHAQDQKQFLADEEASNKLKVKAGEDINALAEKTEKLNDIEEKRSQGLKLRADLEEKEIARMERLGAIARAASLAGVSGKPAMDAANKAFDTIERNMIRQAGMAAFQTPAEFTAMNKAGLSSLLRPVDPNLVIAQKEQLAKDASALASQAFREGDKAESERLNRLRDQFSGEADAMRLGQTQLKQDADARFGALAKGDFRGIASLIGADFSGLNSLAGEDFTGLKSLSGLTISIK